MLHFYRAIREDLEYCFYIETRRKLNPQELSTLNWLLSETFEPDKFSPSSIIGNGDLIELGPRMNFETAYSTNAVSICRSCGLDSIIRLERSRRYLPGPYVCQIRSSSSLKPARGKLPARRALRARRSRM